MRIGRRVDHYRTRRITRLLDPVHKHAFMVALTKVDNCVWRGFAAHSLHICERIRTIDFRLPLSQQVEVGSVQNKDGLRHDASFSACPRQWPEHTKSASQTCQGPPHILQRPLILWCFTKASALGDAQHLTWVNLVWVRKHWLVGFKNLHIA